MKRFWAWCIAQHRRAKATREWWLGRWLEPTCQFPGCGKVAQSRCDCITEFCSEHGHLDDVSSVCWKCLQVYEVLQSVSKLRNESQKKEKN